MTACALISLESPPSLMSWPAWRHASQWNDSFFFFKYGAFRNIQWHSYTFEPWDEAAEAVADHKWALPRASPALLLGDALMPTCDDVTRKVAENEAGWEGRRTVRSTCADEHAEVKSRHFCFGGGGETAGFSEQKHLRLGESRQSSSTKLPVLQHEMEFDGSHLELL